MVPVIMFVGATGSGKSTQAKLLANKMGMDYISTGDLLRASGDAELRALLEKGELSPSAKVHAAVTAALRKLENPRGVIVDGLFRTIDDVKWVKEHLTDFNLSLKAVFYLEVPIEEAAARLDRRDRADDSPQAIDQKWQEFTTTTQPVIEYYRQAGLLKTIDGVGSIEQVANRVEAAL